MVSKYIQSILLMHEQPLSTLNEASCIFNDIHLIKPNLGNERNCADIDYDDCIFNKDILISDIEVISHEQTD